MPAHGRPIVAAADAAAALGASCSRPRSRSSSTEAVRGCGATPLDDGGCRVPRLGAARPSASRCTCSTRRPARAAAARPATATSTASSPRPAPGTRYRYRLDGGDELPDPASRSQPDGRARPVGGRRSAAFAWTDERLAGRCRCAELVIYELHVGTFTPEGTFDGDHRRACDDLRRARRHRDRADAGRPVPGRAQLGLRRRRPLRRAATLRRARRPASGSSTPATRAGSPSSSTSSTTTSAPRATTSARSARTSPTATARRGARRSTSTGAAATRCAASSIDNALHWLDEYHVDGAAARRRPRHRRLSARAILSTSSPTAVARARRAARRGRCTLIAESDLNDPRLVRPRRRRRPRARRAVERRLPPRAARAAHRRARRLLRRLRRRSATSPRRSARRSSTTGAVLAFRGRRHGAPADGARAARASSSCIQNHDQVGNRALGERLSALVPASRRLKLAAGAACCSRRSCRCCSWARSTARRAPFLYFIEPRATPALDRGVRAGGAQEFAAFGWAGEPARPQDDATLSALASSTGTSATRGTHGQLLALYRELLRAAPRRIRCCARRLDDRRRTAIGWIALLASRWTLRRYDRGCGRAPLTCFNCSARRPATFGRRSRQRAHGVCVCRRTR